MNAPSGMIAASGDDRAVRLVELPAVAMADNTANPAPLGLCAFGLTTVLLNLHNAGYFGLDAMILSMGIFYGGIAQIFAGVMEWRKNNTFATTAFISYGFFWLTLAGIIAFPRLGIADAPTATAMACYLGIWGIFSVILFIGTFRLSRALQIVFFLLVVLFGLLVMGDVTGDRTWTVMAGYEGIVCGAAAIYTGLGQVINEVYGRSICPLGPVNK